MSLLRPPVGAHVSELTSTLMKSLSRQVSEGSLDPLVTGTMGNAAAVADVGSAAMAGQGGQVRPGGSVAAISPPVLETPAVSAAQQLSADDRMRALAQLQRIVSAVAAEQPALPAEQKPDAPLPPVDKAAAAPLQMPAEAAAGPPVKKRPRERPIDEDPVEEERVAVWNQVTGKKLTGQAAPKRKNLEKYLRQHPDFSVLYEDGAPSAAAAAANAAANAEASGVPARGDHIAQKRPRQQHTDGLLRARAKHHEVAVTPPLVPTVFEPLPLNGHFERLSPLMGKGTPDFGAFDAFSLWCRPRLESCRPRPQPGPSSCRRVAFSLRALSMLSPRRQFLHGYFMTVAASSFSHAHTHIAVDDHTRFARC